MKEKVGKASTNRALVLLDPGLVSLSLGGFRHPGVVSGMEPPTLAALLGNSSVLPFPYPGSPRGDFPLVSTLPTIQAFRRPPFGIPPRYASSVSPFSFILAGPGGPRPPVRGPCGPIFRICVALAQPVSFV